MRAVTLHGAEDLRLDDAAEVVVGDDQVVVAVAYGGICGSDLHYAASGRNGIYTVREPLVLGHEIVGIVAEVGRAVTDAPALGTPVAIHPAWPVPTPGESVRRGLHLAAGGSYLGSASTWPHTQGGLRDRIAVAPDQLRPIPAGVPLRRAALAEPLAVALHGIDRFDGDYTGLDVLVTGAGPIGCLAVAALRHRGAGTVIVTDLHDGPLARARAVGADTTIRLGVDPDPAAASFDVVIEASGAPIAASRAHEYVRPGGTIVQLGIPPAGDLPVPLSSLVSREITVRGSQRFETELDDAVALLAIDASLDAVVTDVFAAEDFAAAFERARDSAVSGKVLIAFGAEDAASAPA